MGSGAVKPPCSNTGASVTEVGVHWLAGISRMASDTVLSTVEGIVGTDRRELPRGALGYARRFEVGPVMVLTDGQGAQSAAMGCHVEVTGSGCEALGLAGLVDLFQSLGLRASRIDLAADNCPFTPAVVWAEWTAGRVRTKVQIAADAVEGREWRSGQWIESASGDTAYLGSSRAARMARVYDRRATGTRFELQARRHAAAAIAADLLDGEVGDGWALRVLGHLRAFVDFVEIEGENSSRRPLLEWWAAFVGGVERARVRLTGVVVDSFERIAAWVEYQVGPMLAVVEARMGRSGVASILSRGRSRWGSRHLRLASGVTP